MYVKQVVDNTDVVCAGDAEFGMMTLPTEKRRRGPWHAVRWARVANGVLHQRRAVDFRRKLDAYIRNYDNIWQPGDHVFAI